jgi:hypothetical protein
MELEVELRNTSDRMLRTLEQIEALESEKRSLKPGSPRFKRLATEVERLAADIFAQTHLQKTLGDRAEMMTERAGVSLPPIDEAAAQRELQAVLIDWRDAERRLASTDPDSAEHAAAAADVNRLREEYHRAYTNQERRRGDREARD